MITLFTIFHIILFPVQESGKTTCEEKLEALDFIYEYDKEPAVCTHDFCDKGIGECHNGVDTNTVKSIETTYNCFKELETSMTDKVILISYQSLLDISKIEGSHKLQEDALRGRKRAILLNYGLLDNNVYFQSVPKQSKSARIELVNQNDERIKNIKNSKPKHTIYLRCNECPF